MKNFKRTDRSRKLILDAAFSAFRDLGFEQTSMEEIAARAGLTRKTLYNLFASKEDIALQIIARVETEPDASYRARIAANEDVVVLLDKVFLDSAGWCMANPSLARLALAPAERPSLEPPQGRPSFQLLVRDVLRLGQSQGIIRKDEDVNLMALVLLGIYAQTMLTFLAGAPFDSDLIRRVIRLVIAGIGEGGKEGARL